MARRATLSFLALALSLLLPSSLSRPTEGCTNHGLTFNADQNEVRHIQSGELDRKFLFNIPSGYETNSTKGAPLIFAFHGAKYDASSHEELTQLSNETYNPESVVVYPEAVDYWQGSTRAQPGVNDTLFVLDMVKFLSRQLCLDDERFYATGMSIGGAFTNVLACSPETNKLFAAFAPNAAAINMKMTDVPGHGGDCEPGRGAVTPMLEIHGDADEAVPYKGCSSGTCPRVLNWLHEWAWRNGCGNETPVEDEVYDSEVVQVSYSCNVTHYRLHGIGHNWASNSSEECPPAQLSALHATRTILGFFADYKLNVPGASEDESLTPGKPAPDAPSAAPSTTTSTSTSKSTSVSTPTTTTATTATTATSTSTTSAKPKPEDDHKDSGTFPLMPGTDSADSAGEEQEDDKGSPAASSAAASPSPSPGSGSGTGTPGSSLDLGGSSSPPAGYSDSESDSESASGPGSYNPGGDGYTRVVGCSGFHRVLKSVVSVSGEDCSPLAWQDLDSFVTVLFFFLFCACVFVVGVFCCGRRCCPAMSRRLRFARRDSRGRYSRV